MKGPFYYRPPPPRQSTRTIFSRVLKGRFRRHNMIIHFRYPSDNNNKDKISWTPRPHTGVLIAKPFGEETFSRFQKGVLFLCMQSMCLCVCVCGCWRLQPPANKPQVTSHQDSSPSHLATRCHFLNVFLQVAEKCGQPPFCLQPPINAGGGFQ